jgi:hypothetical protein
VRDGYRRAERQGVPESTTGADQIGGHDCLAVSDGSWHLLGGAAVWAFECVARPDPLAGALAWKPAYGRRMSGLFKTWQPCAVEAVDMSERAFTPAMGRFAPTVRRR